MIRSCERGKRAISITKIWSKNHFVNRLYTCHAIFPNGSQVVLPILRGNGKPNQSNNTERDLYGEKVKQQKKFDITLTDWWCDTMCCVWTSII